MEGQNRKLKILSFHGYRQDSEIFKAKLGGFKKGIKSLADLVFIDAPNVILGEEPIDAEHSKCGRSWWFTSKEGSFNPLLESDIADGFTESVEKVEITLKSEGPFDGILGFSQGAAFASLLCGMKERGELQGDFMFAIFIAGFKSPSLPHQYLYQEQISLPTLHIIGEQDTVIPKGDSNCLLKHFTSPQCIYHSGGHYAPTNANVKWKCQEFLRKV